MPHSINDLIKMAADKYLTAPPPVLAGQELFTSSRTFVVPAGVTSISVVGITKGENGTDFGDSTVRSGAGGCLRYVNGISVSPGESLSVNMGTYPFDGTDISLRRGAEILMRATGRGNTDMVGLGFDGGNWAQGSGSSLTGAGAGGYTSAGADSGFGAGTTGGGGSSLMGGGAGAPAGAAPTQAGAAYGGGAGISPGLSSTGGPAGIRIIWGPGRAFPNTNTGDV